MTKRLENEYWRTSVGKENRQGIIQAFFSISTSDDSELKETAYLLKSIREKIGAKVDVKIFEKARATNRKMLFGLRKYDALLFGEIVA